MEKELTITSLLYRYSINEGDTGGCVLATSLESAVEKVRAAHQAEYEGHEHFKILVWPWENDDFYDKDHPDVINVY